MKTRTFGLAACLALFGASRSGAGDIALDADAAAKGAVIYARYCVACHGLSGRGDGSLSKDLRVRVPDLTEMANRSSGRYPYDRVVRIISTAEIVRGHGTVDMPAWGDAFKRTGGTGEDSIEAAVRDLAHHLWSIQKPPRR